MRRGDAIDWSALSAARAHSVTGRSPMDELLEKGAVEASVYCRHCHTVAAHAVVLGTVLVELKCANRRCRKMFDRVLPWGRSKLDAQGGQEFPLRCSRAGCGRIFGRVTVHGEARLDRVACPACRAAFAWPDKPWPRSPERPLTGAE